MPPATAGPSTAAITGLRQLQARGAQRPARRLAAVLGKIDVADGVALIEARDRLEVPAGAEGPALAPEHRHVGALVLVELLERRHQRVGADRVHGIARLGTAVNDGPDTAGLLDANAHVSSLSALVVSLACPTNLFRGSNQRPLVVPPSALRQARRGRVLGQPGSGRSTVRLPISGASARDDSQWRRLRRKCAASLPSRSPLAREERWATSQTT